MMQPSATVSLNCRCCSGKNLIIRLHLRNQRLVFLSDQVRHRNLIVRL